MKSVFFLATSILFAGMAFVTNWNVDSAAAKVGFTVKGPFGTVHGNFSGLEAKIIFNEKDLPGSSITASVDAKTVSTGVGLRNRDLRKKQEWLDTDKYARISFRSTRIERSGNGYKAAGNLTLKGVSRPVEIPFTFTGTEGTGVFKGQFDINREDYGIGKTGGSVANTVSITLEVPVKK